MARTEDEDMKPATMNLDVPPEAAAAFRKWCKRKKMTQRAVLSELMMRFVEEPDAVKRVRIGDVDEGLERAYANVLRRMADDLEVSQPAGRGAVDMKIKKT